MSNMTQPQTSTPPFWAECSALRDRIPLWRQYRNRSVLKVSVVACVFWGFTAVALYRVGAIPSHPVVPFVFGTGLAALFTGFHFYALSRAKRCYVTRDGNVELGYSVLYTQTFWRYRDILRLYRQSSTEDFHYIVFCGRRRTIPFAVPDADLSSLLDCLLSRGWSLATADEDTMRELKAGCSEHSQPDVATG